MQSNICLFPRLTGIGGMVSFQSKLAEGLTKRNIAVSYELGDIQPDSILVIGGSRQLHLLWQEKRRGTKIIQRLDGMNWIHRVVNTGLRHTIRAEYGNIVLGIIRTYLADKIAYQSRFSRDWWERVKGDTVCPYVVIHNGVDLTKFSPNDRGEPQANTIRLLMVEGSLLGGYEFGLDNAIKLTSAIAQLLNDGRHVELLVVGQVSEATKNHWKNWLIDHDMKDSFDIKWMGTIPHERIAEVYHCAHLLYSADVNAACPNSVIESIATGTPVISFDTGALPEILEKKGGIVVPYGGDPWQLDTPDIPSLAAGALQVLDNLGSYQESARERAQSAFDLEFMVDQYVDLLLG